MRLSTEEIIKIKTVLKSFELNEGFKIYLFGRRLSDQKRGGDIDLLLLCPEDKYSQLLNGKLKIKAELEFALDDQRVDLTLATSERIKLDPFLSSVRDELKEL